ncbi:PepSY domain-containing protein [Streptomyces sparsogenes]|uniref:PepSY domain-containing protein n=1 Tax=Streptomyces sparsogenes TaxID=67365 RepID=UPI00340E5C27
MKRITVIAALAAAALTAGAATAAATASGTPAAGTTASGTTTARTTAVGGPAGGPAAGSPAASQSSSLAEAARAALKAVPGNVASIERDDERPGWEVDVLGTDGRWHEVTVHGDGRVSQKIDKDGEDGVDSALLRTAKFDAVEAAARAGSGVTSVELEGKVWEVERSGKAHDVHVNPATGTVTASHEDDDDHEDDD